MMCRIITYIDGQTTLLTGGTAVINQTNTLQFTIPEDAGVIVVQAKIYNNQKTSYEDPYYDDAANFTSSLNANLWRNAGVDITINSNSATVNYRT